MHSNRAHLDTQELLRKRRRIVRRRRRNRLLIGTGAALFAVTAAFSVASFTGTDLAGAAVARAASFMDAMEQRSPGERTDAQLQTKVRQDWLAARTPTVPAVHAPVDIAELIAPPAPGWVPVEIAAPALDVLAKPPPEALFFSAPGGVGPGGGGGPPGGGGGGGGGGGSPPESSPGPPSLTVPPVPEPGTWMTMLLGFALIGWALRRNRIPLPESSTQ